MQPKPVFVFVFPDCMGGVSSFNRNLVNFTSFRPICHIRVILLHDKDAHRDPFTDEVKADEVIRFEFSPRENQYYTCARLNRLLGEEKGCVIADNSMVLNTVGLFGSAKRVVYLVHDYFYINWALQYRASIDAVIAHSTFFRDILLAAAVKDYRSKAVYIPYGVEPPAADWKKRPPDMRLKLVFLGRLVEEKGVLLLKEINGILEERGISVDWTIIGKGPLLGRLQEQWAGIRTMQFLQAADTGKVYASLEDLDILVFPSQFEGTPVSIMEAISRGVVPVVSDLPGGTRDMVTADTGFLCETMRAASYADAICRLDADRSGLLDRQQACIEKGRRTYDIGKASDSYFSFLMEQKELPVKALPTGVHFFSKMDKKQYPGWFVYRLRTLKGKL